ncbi:MAG: TraB/GumN family protein [Alphaproteobacteria bacterium]|nr:TraB/GumN family protein [Alphaproteobacteria bacterium]
MRRCFSTFASMLVLACGLCLGCAQAPRPARGPALWSISDADSTVWLFGSVHLLRENVAWRTAAIDAALAEAELIYFEADTSTAATPRFQAIAAARGLNPPGVALSSLLTPAQNAKLAEAAQSVGLQAAQFEPLRPWLAALQLSVAALAQQGATQSAGVETVLTGRAEALGLEIGYFETAEQQVGFLADLPLEVQLAFLDETLDDLGETDALMAAMDDAWATGDVVKLAQFLENDMRDTAPAVREALIDRRNRAWADDIEGLLARDDDVFIAVGAAHLVGEGSVIALLRERGLAVSGP